MARKKKNRSPRSTNEAAPWNVIAAMHETRHHVPRGSTHVRQFSDKALWYQGVRSNADRRQYRRLCSLEMGIDP